MRRGRWCIGCMSGARGFPSGTPGKRWSWWRGCRGRCWRGFPLIGWGRSAAGLWKTREKRVGGAGAERGAEGGEGGRGGEKGGKRGGGGGGGKGARGGGGGGAVDRAGRRYLACFAGFMRGGG